MMDFVPEGIKLLKIKKLNKYFSGSSSSVRYTCDVDDEKLLGCPGTENCGRNEPKFAATPENPVRFDPWNPVGN